MVKSKAKEEEGSKEKLGSWAVGRVAADLQLEAEMEEEGACHNSKSSEKAAG